MQLSKEQIRKMLTHVLSKKDNEKPITDLRCTFPEEEVQALLDTSLMNALAAANVGDILQLIEEDGK